MSGHDATQGHPATGYLLHSGRVRRAVPPDSVRDGAERDPGPGVRRSAPGSGRSRSLSAAQREWPEYNRAVVLATGIGISALIVAGTVVEAVVR